jgi:hypothetical protein
MQPHVEDMMREDGTGPFTLALEPHVLALIAVQAELVCLFDDGSRKHRLREQRDELLRTLSHWQRQQLRYIALSLEMLVKPAAGDHPVIQRRPRRKRRACNAQLVGGEAGAGLDQARTRIDADSAPATT